MTPQEEHLRERALSQFKTLVQIEVSDLAVFQDLLKAHPDFLHCDLDSEGNKVLHLATRWNLQDTRIVDFFLDQGAEIDAKNNAGLTPLASCIGKTRSARRLIERGASVWGKSRDDPTTMSILNRAMEIPNLLIVGMLVDRGGADLVNHPGPNGQLALHEAVKSGSNSVIKLLIQGGADINAVDGNGRSPIEVGHHFTANFNVLRKTFFMLVAHGASAEGTFKDLKGYTMEMAAAAGDDVDRLAQLMRLREEANNPLTEEDLEAVSKAARIDGANNALQFLDAWVASRAIDSILQKSMGHRP
jgi:hypothetical protein